MGREKANPRLGDDFAAHSDRRGFVDDEVAPRLEPREYGRPIEACGLGARRFLSRASFGLVVTEINMPDIKRLELVSFIKNNEKSAPIPFVIVSIEGSDREKCLGIGVDADLVRRFGPEMRLQAEADLLASRPSAG